MRLLLDTHALLWWVEGSSKLGKKAREAISNPDNDCLVSLVSVWELAIKAKLGKIRLAVSVKRYVVDDVAANGFQTLPIELDHVALTETLDSITETLLIACS